MILADMSNGNEARKRTADGLYSDEPSLVDNHHNSTGESANDAHKKMKVATPSPEAVGANGSSNAAGDEGSVAVPTVKVEIENMDPTTDSTAPATEAVPAAPRSPTRSRSRSPVKDNRSPSPMKLEPSTVAAQRQPSPRRSPSPAAARPATLDVPAVVQSPVAQPPAAQPVTVTQQPAPQSPAPQPQTEGVSEVLLKAQMKWALNTIRSLKRNQNIGPFLQPVNPVALGIPDYFNVIKHPMDISTIEKKLSANVYQTPQQFIDDVRLMLNNCFTYNPPGHQVHIMGKEVEKALEVNLKRMPKTEADIRTEPKAANRLSGQHQAPAIERPKRDAHPAQNLYPVEDPTTRKKKGKGKPDDIKWCYAVWNELMKKKHEMFMFVFYQPVNPVALNIPTYFDVIKEPMDLSTIKKKLDAGDYETAEEFEADFRLMIRNCYTFNRPGDDVYLMGQKAEEVFNHKWSEKIVFLARAQAQSAKLAAASKKRKSMSSQGGRLSIGSLTGGVYDDSSSGDDDESAKSSHLQQMIQQQLLLLQELSKQKMNKKSKNKSRRSSSKVGESLESVAGAEAGQGSSSAAPSMPKAPVPPKPPRPPKALAQPKKKKRDEVREISFEEKKELSEAINNLSGDKLGRVVQIIHESMPQLQGESGQEEIELDIDSLDLVTLNKLWNFVKGTEKRRKNKGAASTDQQAAAARIHELELELARLEGRSDKTKLLQENAEIIQQNVSAQQSSDSGSDESDEDDDEVAIDASQQPSPTASTVTPSETPMQIQ